MLNRLILFISIIAAVILASMLFFTTPADLGPLGIFVFFVMVYLVMLGITTLVVSLFVKLVLKKKEMNWKDYADAGILAFWPVMVLVFISVGSANMLFSLIGATVFVFLSIFLIRKV
ncbi:hypothetical protein IJ798_01195 [Candidatus Saccharibacteria bacterium]|nr:hypothetical protein [Candidatus Saccharibacteria bacterium]